jgi:hypothetical protein
MVPYQGPAAIGAESPHADAMLIDDHHRTLGLTVGWLPALQ